MKAKQTDDTTQLQIKSDVFPVTFRNEKPECFDDIISKIKKMPRHQLLLILNIITINKLISVNPATTASGERSFSTARRIKTWMCSNIVPSRFNSLAILHGHKSLSHELNLINALND